MLNPLAPYMAWVKIGLGALLLGATFIGGCRAQAAHDGAKIAKAQTALHNASIALSNARDSLRGFSTTFDQISAQTRANAKAAAEQVKAGEDQAKQARADKAKSDKRAADLDRQLREERSSCVDAGRRICGIPLQ